MDQSKERSSAFPFHLGVVTNEKEAFRLPSTMVANFIYIYIYHHHHHHHVVLVAPISLTLSRHFSLSFIASRRSSGQHPISSHSCWMYVCAGRPAFAQPCVGVHKSTSLMSSSLLLQQCPACLVHLTWRVFVIGGRWPYSWCLVGCCHQLLWSIWNKHSFKNYQKKFVGLKMKIPVLVVTYLINTRILLKQYNNISKQQIIW